VFTGLPVQVRDAALKLQDSMPKSDVNKEYYTQNMEREVSGLRMICSNREPDGSTILLAMSLLHGL
jgi:hypothetical protein